MDILVYIIISVLLISGISLVGIFTLSLNKDLLKRILILLVSFAIGALFGDVFIHLLPESFEELGTGLVTALLVIFGFLIFFVIEKFIRWRHYCVLEPTEHIKPYVTMNIVGDAIHNLVDGMLIAGSYIVSIPLGITTTIAIVLHEIPQEIGDFAILVQGGLSVRKALVFNLFAALMAVVGAVLVFLLGSVVEGFTYYLIPITAGSFIYIAGPDLIPELHHELRISISILQFVSIIAGVGVMGLLTLLE
ncbi:MAG TPA: ZIP family metal transporter [bacterium (Candidatus Stahlbacteria)]|nr:ZIP family metal transporter [Candidatus Stahlbacteria bacterium]